MEKLKEEVISNIRACLISTKGKVLVRQLEHDYKTLLGDRIPYAKLGYKSMEEFISKIPSLSVSKSSNGDWYVDAKASDKSNHITDMVSKQKSSSHKRAPPKSVRFNNYSKAPATRNWKPTNQNYRPKFKVSGRTAAVSHNQLVTRSPVKSPHQQYNSVMSKVVIPDHSSFKKEPVPVNKPTSNTNASNGASLNEDVTASVNGVLLNTPMRRCHLTPNPVNGPPTKLRTSNISQDFSSEVESENINDSSHTSWRKKITRMMSEVSLERDSGNSSPTSDTKCITPPIPPTDILLTDNPVADLRRIVELYKLGEVDISHTTMKPKKRNAPRICHCKITIDGKTYLSYPNDFLKEQTAEEYCAKQALDELIPQLTRKKSFLLSTTNDIKERIPPMLQVHFQGIWSSQIEADYRDKYMEQLPLNWLEIVDSSDCVAVERIQDRYVLRYCRPGTIPENESLGTYACHSPHPLKTLCSFILKRQVPSFSQLDSQALQKGENFTPALPLDISIPSNTVQFGEENRLYAQITCFMSLDEVWCRQWDTNEFEIYSEMTQQMENYYTEYGYKHKAETIQLGSYYVAYYDSNWYRIRAVEIQEQGYVNCFLIDFGDEYQIDKQNLYNIKREFATSQAQAFVCRLAGLEDLFDSSVPLEKFSAYVGREVILEAAQTDTDETEMDQTISVVMYDFADGKSLNKELLQILTIEIAMPKIVHDTIQEVFVSHLSDVGEVYVQVRSKGFARLQILMEYLETDIEQNPPTAVVEPITRSKWTLNQDRLYLTKDKKDGHWYRTKILDMSPKGDMAQVFFVDRGNYEVTTVAQEVMYPLDKISDVLYQFPAQAVRVKMALDSIPPNFCEIAGKFMKIDSPVLLKIIDPAEDDVYIGQFYKRASDDRLFSINKAIIMEIELNSTTKTEDNALKGTRIKLAKLTQLKDQNLQKENVPSGGSLSGPELPERGEYFEVTIPFAVNPWNFIVQPYSSKDKLDEMMAALQERYKNISCSPLQIRTVLPGQIYATKHSDGIWYRTSVMKVVHSGSISVFYCDFGYYSSLCLDQLIPLDPEFTVLPYQALKAKLSGIKPKNNKWSMEGCEYFTSLVKGKSFISVLMDIDKDELYESDDVLKLTLIDTSTDDDIFIDQELVKQNIAIKAD